MKNNKIPMNITIETKRQSQNRQGEIVSESNSQSAFGFLKKSKSGLELEYIDTDYSPSENKKTTVSMLNDNIVAFDRLGLLNAYMVFENGKSHTCVYDSLPYPLQLSIQTNSLENSMSSNGGRIDIDYTVRIAGATAEHSKVTLTAIPHESIITS